ncbi:hypothetical protein E4U57_000608 [Claviceps arundinis]|uniref:Uncharacterized protein n=1 Tax=Claviceps arundinis TaxID=1623583 RepID=A0A9P7MQN4_9HYPO|nr:hypothetical protein E4U57_000608 [Claviceps arundinis]KAG5965252.1 hypothetical protein E4U56_001850 [Claviceps arundinis]
MDESDKSTVPLVGKTIGIIVSLLSTTALTVFLSTRFDCCGSAKMPGDSILEPGSYSSVVFVKGLQIADLPCFFGLVVFAIYTDSYLFVIASALLQNTVGVNHSMKACDGAILICLACYITTKFIYLFLVEKAHIIRGTSKKRSQSKLYLFNSVGMLGVFTIVVILNFVFRIAKLVNGECIIGMQSFAMIPLISFDTVVNMYLTVIFIIPLRQLYSYRNMPRTLANARVRSVAIRTFGGAVCALISSITNLSVLMTLRGEPGWVCLMCCNCDILFCAIVIQFVTSKDNAGSSGVPSPTRAQSRRETESRSSTRTFHSFSRTLAASSTSRGSVLATSARLSRPEDTLTHGQDRRGGVMVTTTIESETTPASTAQLAQMYREQDNYSKAEEGGIDLGLSVREDVGGSRTSISAGNVAEPLSPLKAGNTLGLSNNKDMI